MGDLVDCAVNAYYESRNRKASIREIGRTFGVPYATLRDRIHGASSKKGRPRYFTVEEELQLAQLIISCQHAGFALSKPILFKAVRNAAVKKG